MRKRQSDARPYRAIIQSRMINVNVAFHRAAFHLHRSRSRLSERLALAGFANAHQQAAMGCSGDQIAVQHESDPRIVVEEFFAGFFNETQCPHVCSSPGGNAE